MDVRKFFGAWTLVSHQFVANESGERRDMFGPDPVGSLLITPDMRMMVLITRSDRKPSAGEADDAALFKSMLCYSGQFRIEGEDQLITRVELAWLPAWVGTEQARIFQFKDDGLLFMTPEMQHPMFPGQTARAVLTWRRSAGQ